MSKELGYAVPIALHLDHGDTFELCKSCIETGFSSVMIDGSHHPYEENIELTKKVVEYAHKYDVTVEGELGVLAGIEDEVVGREVHLHPARGGRGLREEDRRRLPGHLHRHLATAPTSSSPSSAHATTDGVLIPPPLRFDILEEIEKRIPGFPIVLHGSSSVPPGLVKMINKYGGKLKDAVGIPEEQLRKAAKSAVCKINIDSDGRLAMTAVIRKVFAEKPAEFDPRKYLGPARDEAHGDVQAQERERSRQRRQGLMAECLKPDNYARQTLERYTGSEIAEFGPYVLLVNFPRYIEDFARLRGIPIRKGHWTAAHDVASGVSIINFGVGSPSAGIITHCLSCLENAKAVLMMGMCGGIDDSLEVGDIILPTASVRDEGTSRHYIPPDVPAMPHTKINRICNEVVRARPGVRVTSGLMLTTDYRMWEFDREFIDYINKHRIIAIDMEIATIFAVAYALNLPAGAVMLVSDMPLRQGGIKDRESMKAVFTKHTESHLEMGLGIVEELKRRGV